MITAVADRIDAARARLGWPDVLRALGRTEVRSYALDLLRGCGFSADLFGASRSQARAHRERVADVLSVTEDWLEFEHPRYPERFTIGEVRGRLEQELWP